MSLLMFAIHGIGFFVGGAGVGSLYACFRDKEPLSVYIVSVIFILIGIGLILI